MVELEKQGIPTVSWISTGFIKDAKMTGQIFGAESMVLAVLPREPGFESPEGIKEMVSGSIDQIINGLTKAIASAEDKLVEADTTITIEGNDLLDATDKMNRYFLDKGWSDGFPLVPPTPQAVETMLSGTRLGRDEVVGIIDPGRGIATVEKIAINAVMAGCRPEHMPVLITVVRCLTSPKLDVRTEVMSTGSQAPFILINGPIAKKLNINSKGCALDPGSGSYANIVIGRTLSLMLMNIGQGYPGVMSLSTVGNTLNYSLCVAENEDDSPWESYHVEKGFDKDTSTVTLMFVRGGTTFGDMSSNTAEATAQGQAWIAGHTNCTVGGWLMKWKNQALFLIGPAHARTIARDGWDKKKLRQFLFEHAKIPFDALLYGKELSIIYDAFPQFMTILKENPKIPMPVVDSPDCFHIFVVGGSGPVSAYYEGTSEVTLPLED